MSAVREDPPAAELDPRSPWSGLAEAEELTRWLPVAARLRQRLQQSAVEREAVNALPEAEIGWLREAGLLNLMVPRSAGGAGGHWSTAGALVRELGRADGSIAQLLGNHWLNQATLGFVGAPARAAHWYAASAAGEWFWGAATSPSAEPVLLEESGGAAEGQAAAGEGAALRLRGRKGYATGAPVADILVVRAEHRGEQRLVVVPRPSDGLSVASAWDGIGQRLTVTATLDFDRVAVADDAMLGDPTRAVLCSMQPPAIHLLFAQLYLGLGRGALEQGRELIAERRRPWPGSSAEHHSGDAIVERGIGALLVPLEAAEALADAVALELDALLARAAEDPDSLTMESRGELMRRVSTAKTAAADAALAAASGIFEFTGARSARTPIGLDRYWRDLRTHTLHDPLEVKRRELGAAFLTGSMPEPSLYS